MGIPRMQALARSPETGNHSTLGGIREEAASIVQSGKQWRPGSNRFSPIQMAG